MSKCFEPLPSEARILNWLVSLPTHVAAATTTPPATTTDEEHFAKRRRLSFHEGEQQQTTPRHPAPGGLPLHTRPTPEFPTRRRSRVWRSAATLTTLDLQGLEVPVFAREIDGGPDAEQKLPADILPLYKSIRSVAIHRKAFIPAEVRDKIEAAYGDGAQPHWFRPGDARAAAVREADADFQVLRSLLAAAEKSKTLARYEDAWNAEVHLPILKLAVSARPNHGRDEYDHGSRIQTPEVAAELVTSATLTADAIPRFSVLGKRAGPGAKEGSVLACSVSQSGASSATSGSEAAEPHSRKASKKVNLVLVLVPPPSSRLDQAITWQLGSVNQSLYGPLRRNPIACSIETKTTTARTNPVVQLAIWTVAWYRRMDAIWRLIHGQDTAGRPAMVSLPLITIFDHEWHLYYAVDGGDRITFFGPEYMGSTSKLDAIYVLRATLGLLHGWIQTTFHTFLEEWFGCR